MMTSNIYVFDNSQEMKDHMASPQTRTREDKKVRQVRALFICCSTLLFPRVIEKYTWIRACFSIRVLSSASEGKTTLAILTCSHGFLRQSEEAVFVVLKENTMYDRFGLKTKLHLQMLQISSFKILKTLQKSFGSDCPRD